MCKFPRAAITRWLRTEIYPLTVLEATGPRSLLAGPCSPKGPREECSRGLGKMPSLPHVAYGCLQSLAFLVCRSNTPASVSVLPWPPPLCVCVSAAKLPFSSKDARYWTFGPLKSRVTASLASAKNPVALLGHLPRLQGLGLEHTISWETQFNSRRGEPGGTLLTGPACLWCHRPQRAEGGRESWWLQRLPNKAQLKE